MAAAEAEGARLSHRVVNGGVAPRFPHDPASGNGIGLTAKAEERAVDVRSLLFGSLTNPDGGAHVRVQDGGPAGDALLFQPSGDVAGAVEWIVLRIGDPAAENRRCGRGEDCDHPGPRHFQSGPVLAEPSSDRPPQLGLDQNAPNPGGAGRRGTPHCHGSCFHVEGLQTGGLDRSIVGQQLKVIRRQPRRASRASRRSLKVADCQRVVKIVSFHRKLQPRAHDGLPAFELLQSNVDACFVKLRECGCYPRLPDDSSNVFIANAGPVEQGPVGTSGLAINSAANQPQEGGLPFPQPGREKVLRILPGKGTFQESPQPGGETSEGCNILDHGKGLL